MELAEECLDLEEEEEMNRATLAALSVLLACFAAPAEAQTSLQGDLPANLGPGTYIVDGDCRVAAGSVVTIEPETQFLFNGHYTWFVSGTLLAEGCEGRRIVFTPVQPEAPYIWGGIRFVDPGASSSVLEHCLIEHTYRRHYQVDPDCNGGGIFISNASPLIRNSIIRHCEAVQGGGIYATAGSAAVVDRCTISHNKALVGAGINIHNSGQVSLTNSTIYANAGDGI